VPFAVVQDVEMEMPYVFSPEIHDAERGLYRFRCYLTTYDERWTFWIAEATVTSLPPCYASETAMEGESLFGCYRQAVHQAALLRMTSGEPHVEHVLTQSDFNQMLVSPDDGVQAHEINGAATQGIRRLPSLPRRS
jgi:hypothetical protein